MDDLDVAADVATARRRNRAAELDVIRSVRPPPPSDATDLTAGGRRLLNAAAIQLAATKNTVNTIWPPVAPED
jgi:hypothetical protein